MQVLVCTHLSEIFNEYHLPKVCNYLIRSYPANSFIRQSFRIMLCWFKLWQSESLRFYTMSILKPNNSITKGVDDIVFLYRYVHCFIYSMICINISSFRIFNYLNYIPLFEVIYHCFTNMVSLLILSVS